MFHGVYVFFVNSCCGYNLL